MRTSIKFVIVGATGTGKSALACALRVTNLWEVTEATALMAALTRDLLFHDTSLYPKALHQHRQFALTLLTGLDLPLAHAPQGLLDPAAFDQRVRQLMDAKAIAYAVVYGTGQSRTNNALQAITHLGSASDGATITPAWHWSCNTCSDADYEHQIFSRLVQRDSFRT